MTEAVIAIIGLVGGFLIAIGWYRRGLVDMEKELIDIKGRVCDVEKDYQGIHTDLEVIKQRMIYMESKIDEIHKVIMRPINLD